MSQQSFERIPHAGLQFLITRVLSPRIGADEAMWYVRQLYGDSSITDQDWTSIRGRVARMLVRLRSQTQGQQVHHGR